MKYRISFVVVFLFAVAFSTNAQVINAGIGGNNTTQLLQRIDEDVINQHPDLTIVMVGTNDRLNSRKMISYEQYSDNLNQIVQKLKSAGIEVLLMSSPPVDSAYLFTRHDRSLFTQTPNEIMDSVSNIVEKVAADNNALFLNLHDKFAALGLPKHDEDLFFRNSKNSGAKDGVHPTALGYHFIAENVFQYLKEKQLLKPGIKIVCFGDSITNGAGSKGGGTVTGDNYPSFLFKRISDLIKK
jgi:lysophospholipase L1-like esterase